MFSFLKILNTLKLNLTGIFQSCTKYTCVVWKLKIATITRSTTWQRMIGINNKNAFRRNCKFDLIETEREWLSDVLVPFDNFLNLKFKMANLQKVVLTHNHLLIYKQNIFSRRSPPLLKKSLTGPNCYIISETTNLIESKLYIHK